MLVLSRKKNEQIRIGDHIIVTVQKIHGNRVSLGIEAPRDCRILRGELPAKPSDGSEPSVLPAIKPASRKGGKQHQARRAKSA